MKKVLNQTTIFDGSDQQLYTSVFDLELSNGDTITFRVDQIAQRKLNKDDFSPLSKSDFSDLIKTNRFDRKSFPGTLLNSDQLPVKIGELSSSKTKNRYTVVSANGEKQPMRYMLVIEAVWQI